ncbi:hypothetical protein [Pectinatus frisingensis]|uniref:hypothetical protein n=1 Tax=Pectinatus frisingensis TaxID=865 RepID=UPI0018C76F2B|nr:hypothetical protein [Pectinatus frisingensis]
MENDTKKIFQGDRQVQRELQEKIEQIVIESGLSLGDVLGAIKNLYEVYSAQGKNLLYATNIKEVSKENKYCYKL